MDRIIGYPVHPVHPVKKMEEVMSLRVISGKAKGRKLKQVPGDTTRPAMDRVKENLFNLLGPGFVPGTRWLDMFAGTGQVGIEALSRGAAEVVFLDRELAAIRVIHENLEHTQLKEGAVVRRIDAFRYLLSQSITPFDVIYVAPPQYLGIWSRVLAAIDPQPDQFLRPEGLVIVQIDPREYEEPVLANLVLDDQRTYGNTMLCFYAAGG
jgi:16S rRNA (guanine(966)-N(2))-methyltransferase RsmD